MSLCEIIQTSTLHKQGMMESLQSITIPSDDLSSFTNFIGALKASTSISFEPSEIPSLKPEDHELALFITAQINDVCIKRVMIDSGVTINIISSLSFDQLKLPNTIVTQIPILLRSFNDTITPMLGTVILPLKVGV